MDKSFKSNIGLSELDAISLNNAYKVFNAYKEKGIILNTSWDSERWFLTDEYSNTNFLFSIKDKEYFGLSKKEMTDWLKTYICQVLGQLGLGTTQRLLVDLRTLLNTGKEIESSFITRIEEFISVLPIDDDAKEELYSKVDNFYGEYRTGKQRTLAAFNSYFLFNDILDNFWKECSNVDTKLFYFPIWLWWKITVIIPQRPKEFILMPRNCLTKIDDKYFIKLRRDKLKGGQRTVTYKINEDFEIDEYQITPEIGKEIEWYLEQTKDYYNHIDTLLVMHPHYQGLGRSVGLRNRYLTRANFSTIFRYFYKDIIQDFYGYEIVEDRTKKYLNSNQIQYLHLGDTRHLSMINIIAEGGTPLLAMELAGHDNVDISANYFSNITRMIECKTYRLANGQTDYLISGPTAVIKTVKFSKVKNGRCYSEKFENQDFEDCCNAYGEHGEIGACEFCPYFRKDGFANDSIVNRLNNQYKQLSTVVNAVRKNKGDVEEIVQVMNQIKTTAYTYQQFLLEDIKNGKK